MAALRAPQRHAAPGTTVRPVHAVAPDRKGWGLNAKLTAALTRSLRRLGRSAVPVHWLRAGPPRQRATYQEIHDQLNGACTMAVNLLVWSMSSRARPTSRSLRMRLGVWDRQHRAGHARDPNPPGGGPRREPAARGIANQAWPQQLPALTLASPRHPVDDLAFAQGRLRAVILLT